MLHKRTENCIYLDHHATTPLDQRVFEKMKPFFFNEFGNPASSTHPYGWTAQDAIDEARIKVASAINAHPSEIIFTSGATESTNMALKGFFFPKPSLIKKTIVSSSIEHGATLMTLCSLEAFGLSSLLIKPSPQGIITNQMLEEKITADTAIVSLSLVNNEVGAINDISALSKIAKEHKALFHCDGAQALGRVAIDVKAMGIDLMSLSSHKIYGPKGVGALYISREIIGLLCPLIHGGGQEWHKRSGTLNVPGIVGFGEAAYLAEKNLHEESAHIKSLRDIMWAELKKLDGIYLNGPTDERVAGNLNISFSGIDGEELLLSICHKVALSSGSACASGNLGQGRVLNELGIPSELRQATLRIGIGRSNTLLEIKEAAKLIASEVQKQRARNKGLLRIKK